MPRFEQIQATRRKRTTDRSYDQPTDRPIAAIGGGTGPDIDELLERIETVLSETTVRALGRQASADPA